MAVPKTIVIRKWHVVVLLFAALLTTGYEYSRDRRKVEVLVSSPSYQDIESTLSTKGTVTPIHDFPARANFSGEVERIYVHLGDKVRPGQMLILLKDQFASERVIAARAALEASEVSSENVRMNGSQEDLIGMQADLARAQNEQDAAARAYSTLEELEKRGSVSEAEVTAGRQRLETAKSALQALKEKATKRYSETDIASWKDKVAADKASLEAEKVSYANAHVASPIAGTVYLLSVAQYDFVPAGLDMLHVADLTKTQIHADFEEPDIGKLQVGEPVSVSWEGRPNQSWKGRVVEKPLAVTRADARNVGRCTIDIDDPEGSLPVGTNVVVTVTVDKHANVLTVPREALHTEGPSRFAYRVQGDKLVKTPVEVGIVNALRAEITKGLQAQDVLALRATGDYKLKDNLRVVQAK
jgi:HlyD family secretion protein